MPASDAAGTEDSKTAVPPTAAVPEDAAADEAGEELSQYEEAGVEEACSGGAGAASDGAGSEDGSQEEAVSSPCTARAMQSTSFPEDVRMTARSPVCTVPLSRAEPSGRKTVSFRLDGSRNRTGSPETSVSGATV